MLKKELLVNKNTTIRTVINTLVDEKKKAVFIIDDNGLFYGLYTNGDMRNTLLSNIDFSNPISTVCNTNPITFTSNEDAYNFSKNKKLVVYPIVKDGYLLDALFEDDDVVFSSNKDLESVPIVMMAGGKGTRLYPYTQILPKALIPIGDITISERIINSFTKYGCNEVYFILNHKANMIKEYYNELKKSYVVHYETEQEFLGTAGGLYLVKDKINNTFFVTNCDILIEDDLSCAYKTHKMKKNVITMICSSKYFSVPYGVIETNEKGEILNMKEKPSFDFLVNTGIYVVEPEALSLLKENEFIGMPDLIKRCADKGMNVGIFPVGSNSWLDMGELTNMEEMLDHFKKNY